MIDERELLEKELERFTLEPGMVERVTLRLQRKRRRERVTAGALGIALTIAVVAVVLAILRDPGKATGDTPTPSPASELPRPLVALDRGYYYVDVRTGEATPMPQSIAAIRGATNFEVSPDGSMILFDNSGITAGEEDPTQLRHHQLYLANVDGSDVRRLTHDPVGASQGSWSPDGTKIVYLGGWAKLCCWDNEVDLSILDLETVATMPLARGPARQFQSPAFGPTGDNIFFTRWVSGPDEIRADLWAVPVGGGSPTLVLEDREMAQLSPNGGILAYTLTEIYRSGRCGTGYDVAWISAADGSDPRALDQVAKSNRMDTDLTGGWSPDGTRIAYTQPLEPPYACGLVDGRGAYVMDIETGGDMLITYGEPLDWLDDRTLLIHAEQAPRA